MRDCAAGGRRTGKRRGFSLVEVLVSMALVGLSLIGLVQLFTLSVAHNLRANQLSAATFLCQQKLDYLRTLTITELNALDTVQDEELDINSDGTVDYRRVTNIQRDIDFFKVFIFPPSQLSTEVSTLIASPDEHQVRAQMGTIIER
jgi:prepilin-type N-terminal cleavage/methylation domain-containing protein